METDSEGEWVPDEPEASVRLDAVLQDLDVPDVPGFDCKDAKWRALEEAALINALAHNSTNWIMLADCMTRSLGKTFTPEELRDHYQNTYMKGDIADAMKIIRWNIFSNPIIDHATKEDDEDLKAADLYCQKHVPEDFLKKLGYMPQREEFFVEKDNNKSDQMIADLNFKEIDDDYDKHLYFLVIDSYRYKLKERSKAKDLVKKYSSVTQYYKHKENKIKKESEEGKKRNTYLKKYKSVDSGCLQSLLTNDRTNKSGTTCK